MPETLTGTCLCGGVEYAVSEPQSLGYCHCTRCQHWTGSSLAGVVVAKEKVAAGLMPDLDLRPSFHQQVAYKATWHEIGDDAPQFAEMPT
jgi:hypothetical protein